MKKIALVEDNPDNRLLVRVMLDSYYQIVDYETGADALAGMRNDKPDLVLLDISLPEMDGVEVLRQIRADDALRDLPVIALTANAMAGDREKYFAAGFNDYVAKPIVDEALLLEAIGRRLATAHAAAGAGQGDALNPSALDRLRNLGGDKFTREMIDLFLSYVGEKIAEARQAQLADNLAGVASAAHAIRSSAGNVGAASVQALATRAEQSAAAANRQAVAAELLDLERAFTEIKPLLEAARAGLQGG